MFSFCGTGCSDKKDKSVLSQLRAVAKSFCDISIKSYSQRNPAAVCQGMLRKIFLVARIVAAKGSFALQFSLYLTE
jgi:hypothetical protein